MVPNTTYEFQLVTANGDDVELLPEVLPSSGTLFVDGGDKAAFDKAKEITSINMYVDTEQR